MKGIITILTVLLSLSTFATESFISNFGGKLHWETIEGKPWCTNGVASFRFLIHRTDLSKEYPKIKIKALLVKNNKNGEIRAYKKTDTKVFGADETYVIEGGERDGEFPALILKSQARYSTASHSAIIEFDSWLDENQIPVVKHSKEVAMGINDGDDFDLSYNQNYFGVEHRGNRLMLHCGGWGLEGNYIYDSNPFE